MTQMTTKHSPDRMFAILSIDGRRFYLPQEEIHSLELVIDIDKTEPLARTVGWFLEASEKWPLYCLDRNLNLLFYIPASRKACVLISDRGFNFGVLCDQVSSLENWHSMTHPVPKCMATPHLPVEGLIVIDGKVECVTTTMRLAGILNNDKHKSAYGDR